MRMTANDGLRRFRLFSLCCLAAAGLFALPARAEFPTGKPGPAFNLKQPNGKPLALSWLKGKVVLLDFWGPG